MSGWIHFSQHQDQFKKKLDVCEENCNQLEFVLLLGFSGDPGVVWRAD